MALGESALSLLENLAENQGPQTTLDRLNMFGIIRMLETAIINIDRIHVLWDSVAAHLDCLANCKYPHLRALAVDGLTCLTINVFMSHQRDREAICPKEEGTEPTKKFWQKSAWQGKVLAPVLNCLKSGFPETVRTMIHNLPNILDNCGSLLSPPGWGTVYQILGAVMNSAFTPMSGCDPYEMADLSFKFIESLVQKHLDFLDSTGILHVTAALGQFAAAKGDINISLAALELAHVLADHLVGCSFEGDELWTKVLGLLKEGACDERQEVRHKSCTILEIIVQDHAEAIPGKLWHYVFVEVMSQVLHLAELTFMACRNDGKGPAFGLATPTNIATPKFSMGGISSPKPSGRVMRFDEDAIRKSPAEDQGKHKEKQWEETIAETLSVFVRTFARFHQIELGSEETEVRVKVWHLLLEAFIRLTKKGTYTIVGAVLKGVQTLSDSCRDLMHKRLEDTWRVFEEFMVWIGSEHHIVPHYNQRPIGSRLSPVVVDALRAVFVPRAEMEEKPVPSGIIQGICELLKKMLASSQTSEGFQGISAPQKLLAEEKAIFGYMEEIIDLVQTEEQLEFYMEFLLGFLHFRLEEPHIDAFIRRILAIIESHITSCRISVPLLKKVLPELVAKIATIIDLRYNAPACKMLLFNSKDSNPLWYTAGIHLLNVAGFLLAPGSYIPPAFESPRPTIRPTEGSPDFPFELAESGKKAMTEEEEGTGAVKPMEKVQTLAGKKKPKPSIRIPEEDFGTPGKEMVLKSVGSVVPPKRPTMTPDEIATSPDLQETVWELTLKTIKSILCIDEKALGGLDKYLAEDIAKKSQDLGIHIVDFICKTLLPASSHSTGEKQHELIKVIDTGCAVFSAGSSGGTHSFGTGSIGGINNPSNDALSRHCLNILIEMCETGRVEEEEQSESYREIKGKIAKMATPVLINRCKEVVKKFLADEKRNGLVPLPKQRVTDLIGLLERLKETATVGVEQPDKRELARAIMETGKGHLVYIMPELVECIGSKEGELRDKVKEILITISEILIGPNK